MGKGKKDIGHTPLMACPSRRYRPATAGANAVFREQALIKTKKEAGKIFTAKRLFVPPPKNAPALIRIIRAPAGNAHYLFYFHIIFHKKYLPPFSLYVIINLC
jgi:hypothetical protein